MEDALPGLGGAEGGRRSNWPHLLLHRFSPSHESPLWSPGPQASYICFSETKCPKELGFISDDIVLQIFGHMFNL